MKDPFELNAKSIMALYELFLRKKPVLNILKPLIGMENLFHHLTRPLKFIN